MVALKAEVSPSGLGIRITSDLSGSSVSITTPQNISLGFLVETTEVGEDLGLAGSEYQEFDPAPNPPAEPQLQFQVTQLNWYTAIILGDNGPIEVESSNQTWSCSAIVDSIEEVLDICNDPDGFPFSTELYPQDAQDADHRPLAGYTIP